MYVTNCVQEYFESVVSMPISFFDAEDHSSGTLVGRIANDPTQLSQLLGWNSVSVLVALLQIIGGLILAFCFGWKLTLVVAFTAIPIIMASVMYRLRYETKFEKMNNAVFAESAKFATEALSAFRTVTSLTMEETIIARYKKLLDEYVGAAPKEFLFTNSSAVSMQKP